MTTSIVNSWNKIQLFFYSSFPAEAVVCYVGKNLGKQGIVISINKVANV